MASQRIKEADLIEPVLKLISKYGDAERGLDITKIDELLREQIPLTAEDKKILKGRKDDRFSQVIRNLVSHRTLERKGLAEYRKIKGKKRGAYYLTPKGINFVDSEINNFQPDLFK